MIISNNSKKRCAKLFPYKGVWKLINSATKAIEYDVNTTIAESIYDYSDPKLYNVMLYLLKNNCNIAELNKFDYINV